MRSTHAPPQLVSPTPHAVHAPPTHTDPDAHAFPQTPQFDGSIDVLEHAPGAAPHTVENPAGHVHALATHAAAAGHFALHAPQFAGSVVVSTHAPPQLACPVGQVHVPLQICPDLQAFPHAPQFAGSVSTSVHAPGGAPHTVPYDEGHLHAEPTQAAAAGHERPHPPQLAGVLVGSTHVPLQRSHPTGHAVSGVSTTSLASEVESFATSTPESCAASTSCASSVSGVVDVSSTADESMDASCVASKYDPRSSTSPHPATDAANANARAATDATIVERAAARIRTSSPRGARRTAARRWARTPSSRPSPA